MPKSIVYGPVSSWRLGRSLGIDLLCTDAKTCNFDCVYCQLGFVRQAKSEREAFVKLEKLGEELNAAKGVAADWVTFAGMGEPTLAANLGEAIKLAKSALGLPVAVFTNGSLLKREDVRRDLALADMVIAKIDAIDEANFQAVNRPAEGIGLSDIIQGLQLFRLEYKGKLAVDTMLTDMNKANGYQLSINVRMGIPDMVYLNTPLRACAVKPLTAAEVDSMRRNWFWNFKCQSVYEAKKTETTPIDEAEAELRHPTKTKSALAPEAK